MPPVIATAIGPVLGVLVSGGLRSRNLVRRCGIHFVALSHALALDGRLLERRRLGRGLRVREHVLGEVQVRCPLNRCLRFRRTVAVLDALQRQRQPATLRVDLQDQDRNGVPLRHDLTRVLDVVLRELGDVHEPFDARKDLDERAERHDLRHAALDDVALLVLLEHLLPRVGLRLLEAERDALALAVDVEHLHLHLLADVEHLGRVVDVRPRELADMDQAVHAVEIDEGAEVDDVRDRAVDDVARVEAVEDRLAHLLALVLQHCAAREHDVVARAVELDHLATQLLSHELVEVLHAADVDERRREETAHTEIEDQTALDDLDHAADDRLAGLGRALDRLPRDLEARALLRQDQPAFGVLLRQHECVDLVADRDLVARVDRAADRELGNRNDALGLVADVDQHLVLVDAHDLAVDDLALVDRWEGGLVVWDQLAVWTGNPNAVAGNPCVGLFRRQSGGQCTQRSPAPPDGGTGALLLPTHDKSITPPIVVAGSARYGRFGLPYVLRLKSS